MRYFRKWLCALLVTDDYREKMAQGIADDLCAYFGR